MSSSELAAHARRNREQSAAKADDYPATHGRFIGRPEPRRGGRQVPESELGVIGDVSGR